MERPRETQNEIGFAAKNLSRLSSPLCLAQEVVKGLGRGEILLSALQRRRMTEPFPDFKDPVEPIGLAPHRTGGLHRLGRFASRTGRHYARTRNHNFGAERRSNVSALIPGLQHRLASFERLERDPAKNARHRDAIAGNAGITQKRVIRPYGRLTCPHAKDGFWGLKKTTPAILWDLNLTRAEGTPHG